MKWIIAIFITFLLLIIAVLGILVYKGAHYLLRVRMQMQRMRGQIEEIYYFTSSMKIEKHEKEEMTSKYTFDEEWNQKNPIIVHALGAIDGNLFTESLEAFEYHYKKGSRVFEVDLSMTSDGMPVILHDWESFDYGTMSELANRRENRFREDFMMKYNDFAEIKILGKYTPLTLERFVDMANRYSDACFILSVKSVNQAYDNTVKETLKALFAVTNHINSEIRKRYILHAYSFDFLDKAMKDFGFKSVVYRINHSLHPLVLAEQLKKYGINTTTIVQQWYVYNPLA